MAQPTSRRAERAAPAPVSKPQEAEPNPPVIGGAEVISLQEAEEAEDAAVDDEEIVDIGGDDADIPAGDDDDNTFLEEEEEGDADVSGIVGGGAKEEN